TFSLFNELFRLWDGLLCWDETPAGTFVSQNCPDYPSFDPLGKTITSGLSIQTRALQTLQIIEILQQT
uniref:G-protein coupled receptors family 2 profile 1 domain-containing protein n=1 Tax=Sinocyclocheilus anshuiensis TaxID=1608454 RepID=A0A671T0F3_9TELE